MMASKFIHNKAADNYHEVQAESPELPRVDWKKSPGLRKLYFYAAVLCVASATTGYDG